MPLAVGLVLAALGLLLFARRRWTASYVVDVLPGMILLGFGAGIAFNPVLFAAMSEVKPEESGLASGIVNTSFMMGGALGLAVLGERRGVAHRRTRVGGPLARVGADRRLPRRLRGRRAVRDRPPRRSAPRSSARTSRRRTGTKPALAAGQPRAEPRRVLLLVVAAGIAGLDRLPPLAVLAVPRDRLLEAARVERVLRAPSRGRAASTSRPRSGDRDPGRSSTCRTRSGDAPVRSRMRLTTSRFSRSWPPML